jgi:hypothetical protein
VRDLLQILLVVLLGVIERAGDRNLGRDRALPGPTKRVTIGGSHRFGDLALLIVRVVDRRPVLRADVVSLTHPLGGIVRFEKESHQLRVANLLRIKDDEHHFGMTGFAGADLFVGREGRHAAGITGRGRVDPIGLPKEPFRAPEAAQTKLRGPHFRWKRRLDWSASPRVALRDDERGLIPSRQRVLRGRHGGFCTSKQHQRLLFS